ncbi:Hypothetical protein CAP_6767 [Chondromyces apiculatus DSM 436]|uniref:Uncharacterized protein n=1 Tax=Chondromyces apiculatus DSM 436 TaxID=1192034 RepID=A0A017T172_9BACT|nr:Hypothetical protein CAP_6767 [Chondromyces apiculatus DSM 436]
MTYGLRDVAECASHHGTSVLAGARRRHKRPSTMEVQGMPPTHASLPFRRDAAWGATAHRSHRARALDERQWRVLGDDLTAFMPTDARRHARAAWYTGDAP